MPYVRKPKPKAATEPEVMAEGPFFAEGTGVPLEGLQVETGQIGELTPDGARILSDEEAAAFVFPEGPLPPVRRTYRALADFEVQLGETRLLFHKGRRFSTDEIPFDPKFMEPLD